MSFKETFYSLPAELLKTGMSTNDGQDILRVGKSGDGWVSAQVYTPRSDDQTQDAENRSEPEWRCYRPGETVDLAIFEDTDTDGTDHTKAVLAKAN